MKIAIGSDHGGFKLKQEVKTVLEKLEVDYQDLGAYNEESIDYGPIAKEVAEKVANGKVDRGILICGTGIGMSIMANKVKGIKASLVHNIFSAKATRAHNNSNILCMGDRVVGPEIAKEITKVWLTTDFDGGRHQRRLNFIEEYE
ncbi:ribose 5-phosphate isomerase B [Halanaerocella petrolearia]